MTQLNYDRQSASSPFSARRIQRWVRRTATRENLVQSVKTLAWVMPLTILIWIYAEREQVRTFTDVSLPIEVRIENPQRIVTLRVPQERVIVANLSGSQANLDRFMSEVSGGAPLQITIDSKMPLGPGQSVPAEAALEELALLKRDGITVESCLPVELAVDVDEMVEKEVTVQAPPDMPTIVGQPVFTPATVVLRGPGSVMPKTPVAYADLNSLDELHKPGDHKINNVRISNVSNDKRLEFFPADVKANVTVRANDVSTEFNSLQVWTNEPAEMLPRARADVPLDSRIVPSVTITGPPDKIAMLNRPDFSPKPRAELDVFPSDDPGRSITRRPWILLPPDMGLHVVNEDSIRPITFQLIDTHAAE